MASQSVIARLQQDPDAIEAIIEAAYLSFIVNGDTVIDGGANRGRHTAPMASAVGLDGRVIAFEPLPMMQAQLLKRLGDNKHRVTVVQSALTRPELDGGTSEFVCAQNRPGWSGLKQRNGLDPQVDTLETITVPTTTIDSWLGPDEEVRFIKLDLEGGEFDALNGGIRALQTGPLVVMECGYQGSADLYGYCAEEFIQFFEDQGFTVLDFFGLPFDRQTWASPDLWYIWAAPTGSDVLAQLRSQLPKWLAEYECKAEPEANSAK